MLNYKLYYLDFPDGVHNMLGGFTVRRDDTTVIFIDSLQSEECQKHFLKHELAHLVLNHFDEHLPDDGFDHKGWIISDSYEAEAERIANDMSEEMLNDLLKYAIVNEHIDYALI